MSVGICHNGNLINAESLRQNLEKHGAIFHSSSDTEVIMHLIRRSKAPTLKKHLKKAYAKLKVVSHLRYLLKMHSMAQLTLMRFVHL